MHVQAFGSGLLAQLESMPHPGGRPKKPRDKKTQDLVLELFEEHLAPSKGAAARRETLFKYPVGSETVHKAKLLKQLPLVHALCALTGRKPSGPLQVKALMTWNQKTTMFHAMAARRGLRRLSRGFTTCKWTCAKSLSLVRKSGQSLLAMWRHTRDSI